MVFLLRLLTPDFLKMTKEDKSLGGNVLLSWSLAFPAEKAEVSNDPNWTASGQKKEVLLSGSDYPRRSTGRDGLN